MAKIIGIDLGTTNSCVAVVEGGKPVVIPNAEGQRTTPSVVAFTKVGERLVGEPAKRQAVTNAPRTVSSVKRLMGSETRVPIDGKCYTPQELSALILQKLKADAEAYLGEPVTEAVITVPAYFNDAQRQATKDAGRIAGLDVRRIINEPTAAALAYGLDNGRTQTVMVYDLGGGTFDVSLIRIGDGIVQVLSTCGDNFLGGDDFDERIVNWLADRCRAEHGVDLTNDRVAMQRLREEAEKAKKELSSAKQTDINLPFLTMAADGALHLQTTLTRAKFEELCADLIERTALPVRNALHERRTPFGQRPGSGFAGRRIDPHPSGAGQGRADDRSGAVQIAEPRRVRCTGRGGAGRTSGRRDALRPRRGSAADGRDPADPFHRDRRRRGNAFDRAQLHDPDAVQQGIHHRRAVPENGAN